MDTSLSHRDALWETVGKASTACLITSYLEINSVNYLVPFADIENLNYRRRKRTP